MGDLTAQAMEKHVAEAKAGLLTDLVETFVALEEAVAGGLIGSYVGRPLPATHYASTTHPPFIHYAYLPSTTRPPPTLTMAPGTHLPPRTHLPRYGVSSQGLVLPPSDALHLDWTALSAAASQAASRAGTAAAAGAPAASASRP